MPEKVIIIGSGPAAWAAAIYSARAALSPLLFEGAITEENRLAGTLAAGPTGPDDRGGELSRLPRRRPGRLSRQRHRCPKTGAGSWPRTTARASAARN